MAFRKDGSFVRRERYREIEKKIASQFPSPVSMNQMILWVKLNVGLSEGKAREYINDVVTGKGWYLENDMIKVNVEA